MTQNEKLESWRQYGKQLENMLWLETYPVAVKFYEKISDVPVGATFPKRDLGKHMAFCQAVALARMGDEFIAMTREDHWCWDPIISFGMLDFEPGSENYETVKKFNGVPDDKADAFVNGIPRLKAGQYEATVVAPLYKTEFEPDVVLIYCSTSQMNWMVQAIKQVTGERVKSEFDCMNSCTYSVVSPMQTGDYRITVPDPGEVERARGGRDEIIFSVPACRMDELMSGLTALDKYKRYKDARIFVPMDSVALDFPRPPFYNRIFEQWGLDTGDTWRQGVDPW